MSTPNKLFSLPRLTELRWIGKRRVSLVTDRPAVIAEAVAAPEVQDLDAYIVINQPVGDMPTRRGMPRDTLFRPLRGQCTADADIERRLLLPFDFDPVRPTGTAATMEQVQLAVGMRDRVAAHLGERGFNNPADVGSGNGRHLYYAADLANTPEVDLLLGNLYHALAREFDQPGVKLDKSVRSAAQLMRFPGSLNHKAQRPCDIISLPETFGAASISLEAIRAVVTELRGKHGYKKPLVARAGEWTPERMEALLDFYSLDYRAPFEKSQGLLWVLSPCPFNEGHTGTSPAVLLTKTGWPKFLCKHDSCLPLQKWSAFRKRLYLETGKWFTHVA